MNWRIPLIIPLKKAREVSQVSAGDQVVAILHANNYRDIEVDKQGGWAGNDVLFFFVLPETNGLETYSRSIGGLTRVENV